MEAQMITIRKAILMSEELHKGMKKKENVFKLKNFE
jgi:hypothetical protein